MLHLPFNTSLIVPIEVALYDGFEQRAGAAGDLTAQVTCLESAERYDVSDGQFRADPDTPDLSLVARSSPHTHIYFNNLPISTNFKRGNYRVLIRDTATGEEFFQEFSLGIAVNRTLGVTAVYDGTDLTLGLWVEEDGEIKTDYSAISSCKLVDHAGADVASGGLTLSGPTNGIFSVTKTIALASGSALLVAGIATCPKPGSGNFTFPVRSALIRP